MVTKGVQKMVRTTTRVMFLLLIPKVQTSLPSGARQVSAMVVMLSLGSETGFLGIRDCVTNWLD